MNLSVRSKDFYNYVGLDMHFRWNRLFSLQAIKTTKVTKEDLADSGFFYFGQGDNVECYKCGITLGTWSEGDQPRDEHAKYSENCPIVKGEQFQDPEETTRAIPDNSSMGRIDERLKSFYIWPKVLGNLVLPLAEAGFYYMESGDETRCFFCAGILDSWQDGDDPWEKHADMFPYCEYVRVIKGFNYIVNLKFKKNFDRNLDDAPAVIPVNREYLDERYKNKCIICISNGREIIFDKCGHVVVCANCSPANKICPVCKMPFEDAIKFYRS